MEDCAAPVAEHLQLDMATVVARASPSITASQTIGEFALMSESITVRPMRESVPKAIFASSTESWARSGAVTEPMNGLSE